MRPVTKLAVDKEIGRRPTFFYRSAREGMRDFLANTVKASSEGVLLPGFIGWSPKEGSGVFDPVRSLALDAGFYGLRDNFDVDLDELTTLVCTGKYRVLVIIHYFGRTLRQMSEIRQLADERGVLVVEDLAHGFFTSLTGHGAAQYGDMSLYSLHKMFPVPIGGMATYSGSSLVTAQHSTMPELALELMSYDWQQISARRRKNFQSLTQRLQQLPQCGDLFRLLWPELGEGDVPQTLPVFITDGGRDSIYASMNAQGLGMVSLYHTLIEEVRASHPRLETLSRHIINFPVHQDVREEDVERLAKVFGASVQQR